ncbi:hypothetical protein NDU88_011333 [Pleurodeles waltl]|uniref:Uncharacterized protein n=1 Tax=Pleurodeles waltl TaxID=8319 RepID=A0AAV7QWY1_PLEWA|nr:hypothetical protein NDU88_011333 [Pleurodeles waltl]
MPQSLETKQVGKEDSCDPAWGRKGRTNACRESELVMLSVSCLEAHGSLVDWRVLAGKPVPIHTCPLRDPELVTAALCALAASRLSFIFAYSLRRCPLRDYASGVL